MTTLFQMHFRVQSQQYDCCALLKETLRKKKAASMAGYVTEPGI
jgi:DNA-directed RNA polymerase subunit L